MYIPMWCYFDDIIQYINNSYKITHLIKCLFYLLYRLCMKMIILSCYFTWCLVCLYLDNVLPAECFFYNVWFFFQCILLSIRTLHVIFRYGIHVIEARDDQDSRAAASSPVSVNASPTRDRRTPTAYYTELGFELAALIIDLFHHLHMLLWSNIFLSMASLVICMQLRYLFHEIQRRVKKHRNYIWVLNHMERTLVLFFCMHIWNVCIFI